MRADTDISITAIGDDGGFYPIGKLEAHSRGVLHLAVSVFLYSGRGLLLQRRAAGKYHSADLWTNSCCSHPDWGEDIALCARRRCREELNLDVEPDPIGIVEYRADVGGGLIEHERAHIFAARVPHAAGTVRPNSNEVSETRWADRDALLSEMEDHPDRFTQWFRQYMSREDTALREVRDRIWSRLA